MRDRERPNQGDVTLFCFLIYPSLGNSPSRSVFIGLFPRASSFSSPHNSLIRCEWICLFWGGSQIDYWALTCLTWARTVNKSGLFSLDLLAGGGEGITACRLWESLPLGKWDILSFSFYITRVFARVNTSLWFVVNQRKRKLCVHLVFELKLDLYVGLVRQHLSREVISESVWIFWWVFELVTGAVLLFSKIQISVH